MAINCGIIGLPNVGKSTIFQALTSASAEIANYPFCTIKPNIGIVDVPDTRLNLLADTFNPKKIIPATVEFVDIAGLVQGASKGEGLGNQFLAHIREVGVIAHVVRCFDDEHITHVSNTIDPVRDIEIIHIELALADLETLDRREEKISKSARIQGKEAQQKAETTLSAISKIRPLLQEGKRAKNANLTKEEQKAVYDLHLITMKPELYVCNVNEQGIIHGNKYVGAVEKIAQKDGNQVLTICGKFESELVDIEDEEEKNSFLKEIGLKESSLSVLVGSAYRLLGLTTFFTHNEDECRAWTIKTGSTAPQAAGTIHTDFEKGFIKAEVYSFEDLVRYQTETKIKEAGRYRLEGKDYVVQDGDIMFVKFNI